MTIGKKQGENILRTQELRRQRIAELGGIKVQKSEVLKTKDKEMGALEAQKVEKDKIMNELKKQGKELNSQLAAYKKQMKKVDNAITAAINRALADAKKAAIKKASEEKVAAKTSSSKPNAADKPSTTLPRKTETKKAAPESVLLNAENIALNDNFVKNRGILPWPVDKGVTIMHYGNNTLPSGSVINVTGITVSAEIGSNVKTIFDGVVSNIVFIEDMQVVIIQHGKYFTTYSNLNNVSVQRGQNIKTGQVIGKVAANLDGIGAIDFLLNDERGSIDPEKWLKR